MAGRRREWTRFRGVHVVCNLVIDYGLFAGTNGVLQPMGGVSLITSGKNQTEGSGPNGGNLRPIVNPGVLSV
jgi:hypothetical protein